MTTYIRQGGQGTIREQHKRLSEVPVHQIMHVTHTSTLQHCACAAAAHRVLHNCTGKMEEVQCMLLHRRQRHHRPSRGEHAPCVFPLHCCCNVLPESASLCSVIPDRSWHAEMYCDKMQLAAGMTVLELGCGWGSFTLFAVRSSMLCNPGGFVLSDTQQRYLAVEHWRSSTAHLLPG